MILKQKDATSNEDIEITNTAIRRRLNTTEDLIKVIIRRKLDIPAVTYEGLKRQKEQRSDDEIVKVTTREERDLIGRHGSPVENNSQQQNQSIVHVREVLMETIQCTFDA